jgi:hypothetical protein
MSLGYNQPNAVVLPGLVGRLDDPDPVVRLAAHEELKRRTGRDFGYIPWSTSQERAGAVSRWRAWLSGEPIVQGRSPVGPRKSLPAPSPQRN